MQTKKKRKHTEPHVGDGAERDAGCGGVVAVGVGVGQQQRTQAVVGARLQTQDTEQEQTR